MYSESKWTGLLLLDTCQFTLALCNIRIHSSLEHVFLGASNSVIE